MCYGVIMLRSRLLVAVVDDEEAIRKSLRRLLAASELDTVTFASGQEFLDSLSERRPDCLVLDVQMPGMTGFDVQLAMRTSSVRVPIVIITAHDEPEIRARCLAAGASAYLCKPVSDETLLDTIARAIEGNGVTPSEDVRGGSGGDPKADV
jgi:FixJ family two-component response regulator